MIAPRRIAVAALVGVAGLVAAGAAAPGVALSVHSRVTYGTWDPAAPPDRIEFCDRRYYAGHSDRVIAGQEAMSGVEPALGASWREVGRTDGGVPYYAMVVPDSARNRFSPPIPCTMLLYLKAGPDAYRG